MHFSTKFRSPLARRLIVAIILFSASITLFMTVLQLFQDYKRGRAGINAQFTQISDVHVRAFAQSVWATNTKEIGIQLEGIRKLPNVAYVALHEGNKLSVASGEKHHGAYADGLAGTSGRCRAVMAKRCWRRQASMRAWWPDSSSSGALMPFQASGRV